MLLAQSGKCHFNVRKYYLIHEKHSNGSHFCLHFSLPLTQHSAFLPFTWGMQPVLSFQSSQSCTGSWYIWGVRWVYGVGLAWEAQLPCSAVIEVCAEVLIGLPWLKACCFYILVVGKPHVGFKELTTLINCQGSTAILRWGMNTVVGTRTKWAWGSTKRFQGVSAPVSLIKPTKIALAMHKI